MYKIRKKWPEAAARYASAVEIWRDLNTNGIYKSELATTLNSQGVVETDSGHNAPAIPLFKEAVSLMRETSAQNATLQPFLGFGLINLASAYDQQHQLPDALSSLKEAQAIFDEGGRKGSKDLANYARHLKGTILRLEGPSRKRH